ncbi:hypothetical protein BU26DRAFT_609947, partial [Trematosphaeria pertusa]
SSSSSVANAPHPTPALCRTSWRRTGLLRWSTLADRPGLDHQLAEGIVLYHVTNSSLRCTSPPAGLHTTLSTELCTTITTYPAAGSSSEDTSAPTSSAATGSAVAAWAALLDFRDFLLKDEPVGAITDVAGRP